MKRSVVRDPDLLARGLEALYRNLDQHYGPVPLLMLLALVPGIEDYWNLVVSAKGLDQLSRATAIGMAVDVLRESLPKKTWPGIGRVSVLHTDDPFVRGINRLKRINQLVAGEDLALHLEGLIVSGVEVSEAIVLQQPKTV